MKTFLTFPFKGPNCRVRYKITMKSNGPYLEYRPTVFASFESLLAKPSVDASEYSSRTLERLTLITNCGQLGGVNLEFGKPRSNYARVNSIGHEFGRKAETTLNIEYIDIDGIVEVLINGRRYFIGGVKPRPSGLGTGLLLYFHAQGVEVKIEDVDVQELVLQK